MDFIRSMLFDARTSATEVHTVDLPVNPISHLIFTIEAYNETNEATLTEILGFINSIKVTHMGRTIMALHGEDLALLNLYLFGSAGINIHPIATDNQHIGYSLIIPFGRSLFNPDECFPGTRRGELQFTMDMTALATTIDNGLISLAAIELPDASPSKYLKSSMLSITAPGATGDNDINLPIGNELLALLVRMTSWAGASEYLFGVDDWKFLYDNVERNFISGNAPSVISEMMFRVQKTTNLVAAQGGPAPLLGNWMDFDPTRDGKYSIATEGASSLVFRAGMGVNEAIYVTPLELVST